MKKCLVLLMVIGLVSAASAAVVNLQVVGLEQDAAGNYLVANGQEVTFNVVSDTDAYNYSAGLVISGFAQMPISVLENDSLTGNLGGVMAYGDAFGAGTDAWELTSGGSVGTETVAGTQFVATLIYTGTSAEELANVQLLAGDWATELDAVSFALVPEPMTIALLGLGGLFLRRRK